MTIPPSHAAQPLLLGRARELADFGDVLTGPAQGRGGPLWVRGEAGRLHEVATC